MKHNQFSESRQNGVYSRPYCKCAVNLRSVPKTNNPSDTFVTTRHPRDFQELKPYKQKIIQWLTKYYSNSIVYIFYYFHSKFKRS